MDSLNLNLCQIGVSVVVSSSCDRDDRRPVARLHQRSFLHERDHVLVQPRLDRPPPHGGDGGSKRSPRRRFPGRWAARAPPSCSVSSTRAQCLALGFRCERGLQAVDDRGARKAPAVTICARPPPLSGALRAFRVRHRAQHGVALLPSCCASASRLRAAVFALTRCSCSLHASNWDGARLSSRAWRSLQNY